MSGPDDPDDMFGDMVEQARRDGISAERRTRLAELERDLSTGGPDQPPSPGHAGKRRDRPLFWRLFPWLVGAAMLIAIGLDSGV